MTPEGYVKDDVKRILKKYHVYYFMTKGSSYGRQGVADFVCCFHGKYLEVETKADKRCKQTAMQKYDEEMVKGAGGIYLLIHSGNLPVLIDCLERIKKDVEAERNNDSV